MRGYRKIIPLRWGDLDAMGHLNNTLYFRLMEEARIAWFIESGLNTSGKGEGPILAFASCDFVKPMTYPCSACVTQTVTRIGRSSMDLDVTIEGDEAEPLLYARGKNVLVWVDYGAGRSVPWPDAFVKAVQGNP
jgi:acyl-CoA thioester hydrolase